LDATKYIESISIERNQASWIGDKFPLFCKGNDLGRPTSAAVRPVKITERDAHRIEPGPRKARSATERRAVPIGAGSSYRACDRDFRHSSRAMGNGSMLTPAHHEASSP
jgi:hypothetical protein